MNHKAMKKKLLKNPAIKASHDELAKAHFTKDQQILIDLIECVVDAKGEFEFYDKKDFAVYSRLHKELTEAKRALYNWVNKKLCKKTLKK